LTTTEIAVLPRNAWAIGLRRLLIQLCASITLFVFLLTMGELGSYIYFRLHPESPAYNLPLPADYMEELNASATHQYMPFVEWRRPPYQGHFITVDQEGVRQTVNSSCNDTRSVHIWMFGDSALWGTGVSDAGTIPSQLAKLYQDSGQSVCIKNFGEAAWVSTQELIELLLKLKHTDRRPDIVIFYDGTDEIFMPDPGAPKDIHQGYRRFREMLEAKHAEAKPGFLFLEKSNTVRALDLISQKINTRSRLKLPLPLAEAEAVARQSLENYQKNLQIIDILARAYGFQAYYFWYPISSFGNKPLTPEEQESVREEKEVAPSRFELNQTTYEMCSKINRPNFFFLGDALDHERRRVYLDGAHLTAEGNGIMAEKIFQILRANKATSSK
jgi:lysophospholipase L1-like esterase